MSREKTSTTPKSSPMEELVQYTAPMDFSSAEPRDILAAVNGETIRIKRGSTVWIKRKFLEALRNAADQERIAYQTKLQGAGGAPLARM